MVNLIKIAQTIWQLLQENWNLEDCTFLRKRFSEKLHNACQLLMVNYRHLKVEYRVGIQASHQPTIFINTYLNISKLLK